MQTQTVFRAGNSKVMSLPDELGFNFGDKIVVNRGLKRGTAFISKVGTGVSVSSVTPEFISILNGINKRYGKVLSELAKR